MIDKIRNFKEPDFIRDLEEILQIAKSALDDTLDIDADVCQELREELSQAYQNAYSAYYEAIKYDYKVADVVLASAFYTLGMKMGEWVRTSMFVEGLIIEIDTTKEKNRNKSPMTPARKSEKEIIRVIEKYLNSTKANKYTQENGVEELELQNIEVSSSSFNRWIKIYENNGKSIFTTEAR